MRKKPAAGTLPVPASFVNAEQSAIVGPRGRNLFPTLRTLALQGIKQPIHSARHALALGGQLGRVLLGDTAHHPPSRMRASRTHPGASTPSTAAACRPI